MRLPMTAFLMVFMTAVLFPGMASSAGYSRKAEQIATVNRMAPLQNPKYDRSEEILGRRVLDRKSKVVGDLRDVLLSANGSIAYLDVNFDRIRLAQPALVNYSGFNIEPVTNGYAMTFDAAEIEGVYPQMLAEIQTAAGEGAEIYSLKKLEGLTVRTESGRAIGRVDDVLFTGNGKRAEAFYVGLTAGTLRGRSVAVPFGELNLANAATTREALISDETADTIIGIAKDK